MKMFLELFNLTGLLVTVFQAVVPLDRKTTQFGKKLITCKIFESNRRDREPDVTGSHMTDTWLLVLTLLLEHSSA